MSSLDTCITKCFLLWHARWCPHSTQCWLSPQILDMEWKRLQPNINRLWVWRFLICFCDKTLVLLDPHTLLWKFGWAFDSRGIQKRAQKLEIAIIIDRLRWGESVFHYYDWHPPSCSVKNSSLNRLVFISNNHAVETIS